MKIQAIALIPPRSGSDCVCLTPELLAATLARYSRSPDGLDLIASKIDRDNPDASVERILRFVDYGHASISGLTGGIPIVLDGISMWLAYQLFNLSQMADGQENSTRYIPLDESGLPSWTDLGFTHDEAHILQSWALSCLRLYHLAYTALDRAVRDDHTIVQIPVALASKPGAIERLRKNYALDRSRYFLPFAMRTRVALVQTARMWVETICGLRSLKCPEADSVADAILLELRKFTPRLLRQARPKQGWDYHAHNETLHQSVTDEPFRPLSECPPRVQLTSTHTDSDIAAALAHRENRYDRCGLAARDSTLRLDWSNIAIAEIRDLNRHRTGHRFAEMCHRGFYLPAETAAALRPHPDAVAECEQAFRAVLAIGNDHPALRAYTLLLGSQTRWVHDTQLDKAVYTVELRTGAGAHFRYAQHQAAAVRVLAQSHPLTAAAITLGLAEPE